MDKLFTFFKPLFNCETGIIIIPNSYDCCVLKELTGKKHLECPINKYWLLIKYYYTKPVLMVAWDKSPIGFEMCWKCK